MFQVKKKTFYSSSLNFYPDSVPVHSVSPGSVIPGSLFCLPPEDRTPLKTGIRKNPQNSDRLGLFSGHNLFIYKQLNKFIGLALCCFLLASCAFLRKSPQPVFQWPLKKYRLTQKFLFFKKPPHLGIDLTAPVGTEVLSSHFGRVVYAGRRLTGYGNVVVLEHVSGWASLYAHLREIKVKAGQKLKPGDVVGTLGNTGRTSGPHLHFELMYKEKPVNPLLYLP